MNNDTRLILDMGARIRDFSQAHPLDNVGYSGAVTRLENQMARAETLLQQEATGHLEVGASVADKREVRDEIVGELLFLSGIAAAAAAEQPGLAVRIKAPAPRASHRRFLTDARVAVAQARTRQDLFIKYGMTPDLLDTVSAHLDQFEQLMERKHAGQETHISARAELQRATEAVLRIASQLDALNRFRFQQDGQLLAAWKSARDIAWPRHTKPGSQSDTSQSKPAA